MTPQDPSPDEERCASVVYETESNEGSARREAIFQPLPRSNMKVTFGHRLEYAAAWFLLKFFRVLGLEASSWLAGKILRLVGPLIGKTQKRGFANLNHVYPDWSDRKMRETLGEVWENLGRVGAEFAHLDQFHGTWDEVDLTSRAKKIIDQELTDQSQIEAAMARLARYKPDPEGRVEIKVSDDFLRAMITRSPVIFATGHLANWEVLMVICGQFDVPCAIVYRAANNALIDGLIIRMRGNATPHLQIPKGPDGTRAFLDALKQNYSLGIMMDQKFSGGLELMFLGREALTVAAPARMSLNFGLPMIPVTMRRTAGTRFEMIVHDAVEIEPCDNLQENVRSLTGAINGVLEQAIQDEPGQWLWFHRRWGKL